MKRAGVIAAIQVCVFLFGVAWLDRTFEGYHVPPLMAEFHKPDADEPNIDDGEQPVTNLTVPPVPPIPNFVSAFPQMSERTHAALFDTSRGTNILLLDALAAR